MKSFILFFLFLLSSIQALAAEYSRNKLNEEAVASLINKEEEAARFSCERIKKDTTWRKITDAINERIKLLDNLTEKDRGKIDLSVASYHPSEYELRKIDGVYFAIRFEREKLLPDYLKALEVTRIARVLRMCGEDLLKAGLLPPKLGAYSKSMISTEEINHLINQLSSNLKTNDDEWLKIVRSGYDFLQTQSRLYATTTTFNRFLDHPNIVTKVVFFPLYDLYEDGEKLFADQFNYERFKNHNDQIISNAIDKLKKEKEIENKKLKEEEVKLAQEKERNLRIAKIKDGEIKIAKSCAEVAVGLIGEKDLVGNYELALSRDFQVVYIKPTHKVYAGIGKIIDFSKGKITVLYSDPIRREEFVFILNYDSNTLWFGDNAAYGSNIVFVGRYVDNTTTQVSLGSKTVNFPTRVYDAICLSSK